MNAEIQAGSPGLLEKAFVCAVLLLSSGAFMSLTVTRGQGQEAATGESTMQYVWFAIYLVALVLTVWKCRAGLIQASREYLLIALSLFAMGSTAWSDSPSVSLRRGVALLLTCLFGIYIGSRFSLREQLRLLAYVCVICAASSFVFGLLGLGNPVEDIPGAWYGIFVHKNVLGRMMVLSILIFAISAKSESDQKARYWAASAFSVLLLLLSRSATSVAVLGAMLGFLAMSPLLRRSVSGLIKGAIAILAVLGFVAYWITQNLEYMLGLFGKDLTLTGRLQLWVLSTFMALQKPWLGHGYNAFWLGPGSESERILKVVQWDAPHAHNGLLELWLEIGLVGVALFMVGFMSYMGRAIAYFRHDRAPENIWPLCFLVFMFISNLTESDFLARNTIFWIVYVAVVATLGRRHVAAARSVATKPRRVLARPAPRVCES
jgi:exopolysaccharide production protein ExoQ